MSERTLYEVLGVERDASTSDIRAAYRRLAREHHPDVNPGDKAAEERFKAASAAYQVLSSPEKRALYDEFGADATRSGFDPERARARKRWEEQAARHGRGFGQGGSRQVDLESLFGGLFGQGAVGPFGASGPRARRGADIEAELQVELKEAAMGAQRGFRLTRREACSACEGRGSLGASEVCSSCGGAGVSERTVTIDVRIPRGTEDGQRLRLSGQGSAGERGGSAGDLLLTVRIAPHPLFRCEGRDLHYDLPVTVKEAMFGGVVDVPTLAGDVELKIPPRSNSGRRLRLRGKGMPARRGSPGDLYVTLQVHVPKEHTPRTREAAETLEDGYGQDLRRALSHKARA